MAGPVLADVEDGVTAVAEASVNQYKEAILLVVGGWDAATDLDLEELSDEVIAARGIAPSIDDRLSASLDDDGKIKAGSIAKQTMVALDSAAATTGDAVRYDEFAAQHTNSSGAHRLDVAIVTKQAQVALDSAGAAAGDATRYEEFTQGHNADGTHKAPPGLSFLYSDPTQSAGAHTDAAALPEYDNDVVAATMITVRLAFQKTAGFDRIGARGQYYASSLTKAPNLQLKIGAVTGDFVMAAATTWTDFDESDLVLVLDTLTNGVTYELQFNIVNDPDDSVAVGKARYISIFPYTE